MEWAYNFGERVPEQKFTATRAEAAMKICGTAAGELKYPDEEMMKDIGHPKFSFFEIVEHWEMKQFFGARRAQMKKILQKMSEEDDQDSDDNGSSDEES